MSDPWVPVSPQSMPKDNRSRMEFRSFFRPRGAKSARVDEQVHDVILVLHLLAHQESSCVVPDKLPINTVGSGFVGNAWSPRLLVRGVACASVQLIAHGDKVNLAAEQGDCSTRARQRRHHSLSARRFQNRRRSGRPPISSPLAFRFVLRGHGATPGTRDALAYLSYVPAGSRIPIDRPHVNTVAAVASLSEARIGGDDGTQCWRKLSR